MIRNHPAHKSGEHDNVTLNLDGLVSKVWRPVQVKLQLEDGSRGSDEDVTPLSRREGGVRYQDDVYH